jgi:hypothetical protein
VKASAGQAGNRVALLSLLLYPYSVSIVQSKPYALFCVCPRIVGFEVWSQPVRVDACQVGLAEVDCPLNLVVASLAERSQIPGKEVPLVVIQVVNREDVRRVTILDSAEFAAPARSPSHPS